jgi:hypothetical protein
MDAIRWLVFIDGREVAAQSPTSFFEALRQSEPNAPPDLGRYLDLLRSRGAIGFGVSFDVGRAEAAIGDRCLRALASLIRHGWVRASSRRRSDHTARTDEVEARDFRTP